MSPLLPHSPRRSQSTEAGRIPQAYVDRWMRPFVRFIQIESASGLVLLICTVAALIIANSPLGAEFAAFWQIRIRVGAGDWELSLRFIDWINDGLMTVFFFVVGLEIKREIMIGELREPKKAALPLVAAIGGMVVPAGIYYFLQRGQPSEAGWGIPIATDIAFVVGFLSLFGRLAPLGLKILLLSLAIADDIGAVLVIAVFYATNISFAAIGVAFVGFTIVVVLQRIGVRSIPVYSAVGAATWIAFSQSGVHPTLTGVFLGLLTPATPGVSHQALTTAADTVFRTLPAENGETSREEMNCRLRQLGWAARESVSPLQRLETSLHPCVAYVIMPLFALANTGIRFEFAILGHSAALAVAAGLILGKPLGILTASWLAVRLGLAKLPNGVTWPVLVGAGCLAGIGFTMSLFIADLALEGQLLNAAKVGILAGSTISAMLGSLLLFCFLSRTSDGQYACLRTGSNQKTSSTKVHHVD